jgi:transcriptional regulator of acetoin/glycerol metabolism
MLPMLNVEEKSLLRSGWKEFIENGKRPIGVNPVIAASWERSSEWNVDPFLSGNCCILTKSALSEKLRQNKEILDIVKPYMRDMHQALRDLGYMMFLTDAEGWVLHAIGDKNIMDDFRETLDFQLGVSWHESVVGTTAVGIALHHCEPVPFIAEEKYCLILKDRACAAAPIKGADSGTVAVLGLATNLHKVIRLDNTIFALLCAAQAAIENKLQLLQTKETLQVINSRYQKVFENVSDAIVTVDSKGNVRAINSKAAEILSVDPSRVVNCPAADVLGFDPVQLDTGTLFSKPAPSSLQAPKLYIESFPIPGSNGSGSGSVVVVKKPVIVAKHSAENRNKALYTFDDIIGESQAVQEIKQILSKAADESCPVMITGPTGTGKELFAHAVHNAGPRAQGPFIAINCGAIPRELIESELFGYEEGAFTGARKSGHKGKFEQANGGTLLLDEIADMPIDTQVSLLRVLEENKITRIGSYESIPCDVRIISATNSDPRDEVRKGNMREDLFWRLNVISVRLPSLAERREDIYLIIEDLLRRHSRSRGIHYTLHDETKAILDKYNWPGNIRELKNVIERSVVFAQDGVIRAKHLPEYLLSASDDAEHDSWFLLEEAERRAVVEALEKSGGNITEAAELLGIARNTLYNKLRKYNIDCLHPEDPEACL